MKKNLLALVLAMQVLMVYGQNESPQNDGWQQRFFNSPETVLPLLIDAAVTNAPELEALEASRQISRNQLKLAKKEPLRSISLNSTYGYGTMNMWTNEAQLNQWLPFNQDAQSRYSVGVGLNYNLEQLIGGKRLRVQSQELAVQQAEAERKIGEREIRQRVIGLYQNLVLANATLEHYQDALQTAYVTKQLADKNFKEGDIKLEEQMAVNELYNNAVLAQVQAENAYRTAQLMLEETIGMTINTLMNSK